VLDFFDRNDSNSLLIAQKVLRHFYLVVILAMIVLITEITGLLVLRLFLCQ